MGVYSADSFTALEVPTLAKMNKLWSNDAAFNDGGGIADNAIIKRHLADASVELASLDWSTFGEKILGIVNYTAANVANFVPQDIPNSTITVYCPAGYTVEISVTVGYQAGSNTEHNLLLWDNIAGAAVTTPGTTAGSGPAISTTNGHPGIGRWYHTPASAQTCSYKLRASGNSGNYDFRGMVLKTRLLKLI